MKLITSISLVYLFLMQVLVPGFDLCCELQKVPTLLEHYSECELKSGTSLLDFISMHYGDGKKDHQEDQHDENLPFHGKHQCNHTPIFFTIDITFQLSQGNYPVINEFNTYQVSLESEFEMTLFQPPKV